MRRELLGEPRLAKGGGESLYRADARLQEGVERVLLPSWDEAARRLVAIEREAATQERSRLRRTLVREGGFPRDCAEELIEYATSLARPEVERRGLGALRLRG